MNSLKKIISKEISYKTYYNNKETFFINNDEEIFNLSEEILKANYKNETHSLSIIAEKLINPIKNKPTKIEQIKFSNKIKTGKSSNDYKYNENLYINLCFDHYTFRVSKIIKEDISKYYVILYKNDKYINHTKVRYDSMNDCFEDLYKPSLNKILNILYQEVTVLKKEHETIVELDNILNHPVERFNILSEKFASSQETKNISKETSLKEIKNSCDHLNKELKKLRLNLKDMKNILKSNNIDSTLKSILDKNLQIAKNIFDEQEKELKRITKIYLFKISENSTKNLSNYYKNIKKEEANLLF